MPKTKHAALIAGKINTLTHQVNTHWVEADVRFEPRLELLHTPAQGKKPKRQSPAILFLHGAYADAWCWALTFMPYFSKAGFDCYALSLRGHGQSDGRGTLDFSGLNDFASDIERAVKAIDRPLIVVGNSMGGLLIQRELAKNNAWFRPLACVLICSVPPSGMAAPVMSLAVSKTRLFSEVAQLALSGSPTAKFLDLLTCNLIVDLPLATMLDHVQKESVRAIWEMTVVPFPFAPRPSAAPMLAMHGSDDALVPAASLEELSHSWAAKTMLLKAMGHIPMLETDWELVAKEIHGWLRGVVKI